MSIQGNVLREGCYLVRLQPTDEFRTQNPDILDYEGTLRLELDPAAGALMASGDLYVRLVSGRDAAVPSGRVPVFPLNDYRFYLRVIDLLPADDQPGALLLRFEPLRFDREAQHFENRGTYTAKLLRKTAPPQYPAGADFYEGQLTDRDGNLAGGLTAGWVTPFLRSGKVEIDRVALAKSAPTSGPGGKTWMDRFNAIKWSFTMDVSDPDIPEPDPQGFWTEGELHEQMLHSRSASTDLDKEWDYYLLCVRRITTQDRGVMFDVTGTDSDNMPREGAAVSSDWLVPNLPEWGASQGHRFGDTPGYFRTAVHELGHAMGLDHNPVDNGFMNTTDAIASASNGKYPENIQWSFAPDDQARLKHGPDITVRPGGAMWTGASGLFPQSPRLGDAVALLTSGEFDLEVSPLAMPGGDPDRPVPLGAPVRLNVRLSPKGKVTAQAPVSLGLKSGYVSGKVVDPKGVVRTFRPLVRCVDGVGLRALGQGESVSQSLTLLRSARDSRDIPHALFPEPGVYRIVVEVQWHDRKKAVSVSGETSVRVSVTAEDSSHTPEDVANHLEAARKILDTPDTLLSLAIGGDHLVDGNRAIQTIVTNPAYKVLRPHFAVVEAKRLASRHLSRKPDLVAACRMVNAEVVLTYSERWSLLQLVLGARIFLETDVLTKALADPAVHAVMGNMVNQIVTDSPRYTPDDHLRLVELVTGAVEYLPKESFESYMNQIAAPVPTAFVPGPDLSLRVLQCASDVKTAAHSQALVTLVRSHHERIKASKDPNLITQAQAVLKKNPALAKVAT